MPEKYNFIFGDFFIIIVMQTFGALLMKPGLTSAGN